MFPAARMTDMTLCPKFEGPVPHVGGPVLPLPITCIIDGLPAAVMNQPCLCAMCGNPPTIQMGLPNIIVCGMPLGFIGDMVGTSGGAVIMGAPTVLVG